MRVDERDVPRPSLPFLLVPALCFWISIRVAEELSWEIDIGNGLLWQAVDFLPFPIWANSLLLMIAIAGMFGLISLVFLLALDYVIARWARRREAERGPQRVLQPMRVGMVFASAFAGLVVGFLCWQGFSAQVDALEASDDGLRMEVVSDGSQGSRGWYSTCRACLGGGNWVKVRVTWSSEEEILPLGMSFVASGRFSRIEDDDWSRSLHQSLVAGSYKPYSIEDARWAESLGGLFGSIRHRYSVYIDSNPGTGAALMKGIVLGDRSQISGTDLDNSFKVTGLTHLLAVSGSHLTVVAMLVSWALLRAGLPKKWSIAVLCAVMVSYLVLTGTQASAFRSCVMASVGSISYVAGRRAHSPSALALAVLVMLAVDPSDAFSVGFSLSVLGVAGICLFLPLASRWISSLLPKRLEAISQPMAMTIVAQLATLPVSVPMFSMLSIGGPLSNLVVAPIITVLLMGGIIAMVACAVFPPLGMAILWLLCHIAEAMSRLVVAMASLAFMAVPAYATPAVAWTIFLVSITLLWIFWPLPGEHPWRQASKAAFPVAVFALAMVVLAYKPVQVVAMDVGQGDSILVRDGFRQVMVDTGKYDTVLRSALGRNQVYHLDAVAITHFDADHCGALDAMDSMVLVDRVVFTRGSVAFGEKDESAEEVLEEARDLSGDEGIVEVSAGDKIRLSEHVSLDVVWPEGTIEESENEDSLVLLLVYDSDLDGDSEFEMLLTGDAESEPLQQMIDDGLVGEVDAIKVGHHGSAESVNDELMEELRPKIALISVGENNRYGHPDENTLDVLERGGAEVYRTDLDGDITLTLDGGSAIVTCANI
ncbi:MAG: DNA internalization-related competence protein ComEC/Rec2 [Coriobacteriales bacterium]|jgi:competence protein ComEC